MVGLQKHTRRSHSESLRIYRPSNSNPIDTSPGIYPNLIGLEHAGTRLSTGSVLSAVASATRFLVPRYACRSVAVGDAEFKVYQSLRNGSKLFRL